MTKPDLFDVVTIPISNANDTVHLNELRFYDIKSANDCAKLCYDNFGKWNAVQPSKYQENISSFIWNKVTILGKDYTIVTDGTQTNSTYFSSLLIFDSDSIDCLSKVHPKKDRLINFFKAEMDSVKSSKTSYWIFKR